MTNIFKLFLVIFSLFYSAISQAGSLEDALSHSAAGMKVQGMRMKVAAQNIANAASTGSTPGAEPYRRKILTVKNKLDKEKGISVVTIDKVGKDTRSEFKAKYDPAHPAANADGYVLLPNVKTSTETLDMKEAQRSYEANLGVIETTKRMFMSTVDLLR